MVALLIATVIYRWQKEIDRETALQIEFRRLCAEYIKAAKTAFFEQPFIGEESEVEKAKTFLSISTAEQHSYITRDQLFLIAPDHILELIRAHDNAFRHWKMAFSKEFESASDRRQQVRKFTSDLRNAELSMLEGMRSYQSLGRLSPSFWQRVKNGLYKR
ncbi:hypothetical protein FA743_12925 [Paracoccus gahaiensis]|uniref:DUF4760 domain-containing protein n=2 Tax=Paracoccus gahaiensis TaxID=1706839 RepID=A0A4U0R7Z3_9RHOB|nr:hypothetical protein FA743_12925 [Paracoccus gahaiensis]